MFRRIRAGDQLAVTELISKYGDDVYTNARECTQDNDLALDLSKSTFKEFIILLQTQDNEDNWDTLLFRLQEGTLTARLMNDTDRNVKKRKKQDNGMLMQMTDEALTEFYGKSNAEKTKSELESSPEFQKWYKRRKNGTVAQILFYVFVCVVIVWVIFGLLRRMGVLPNLDLGYTWFNHALFRLF